MNEVWNILCSLCCPEAYVVNTEVLKQPPSVVDISLGRAIKVCLPGFPTIAFC